MRAENFRVSSCRHANTLVHRLLSPACPFCDSRNVRRSTIQRNASTLQLVTRSKYRCRDCRKGFWVDRRPWFYLTLAAVGVGLAVVAGAFVLRVLADSQAQAQRETDSARFEQLLERAKQDSAAAYEVYQHYANGKRAPAKPGEALEWLQRSADDGNADAQYELAIALREGHETLQDYQRAFAWMQRSAQNGNAQAHYALGVMHRDGIGTVADPVKAYVHFNVAAAQGFADAAVLRNSVRTKLTPEQLLAAQAESRRIVESDP